MSEAVKSYEQLAREDIQEFPYCVVYDDDESGLPPPKFRTWREALEQQKAWNQDCPGHKAKKRKMW